MRGEMGTERWEDNARLDSRGGCPHTSGWLDALGFAIAWRPPHTTCLAGGLFGRRAETAWLYVRTEAAS